jgi:hypothetical protein
VCPLAEPEAVAEVGRDLTEGAAEVSVTFAVLGFQSCLGYEDEAGEGAACAGLAGVTSKEGSMPWVAVELKKGAGCKATAAALAQTRTVCSTSTEASGWVAGRRLAFHAGRAVATEQKQES